MNTKEVKYAHLTKFDGGGAVTAAYQYSDNNDWKGSDHVIVALSFCSPSDQFSKKTGRNKAGGRFNQGATYKVELNGNGVHTAIIDFLFEDFEGQSEILIESLKQDLNPEDYDSEEEYHEEFDYAVTSNRKCVAPFWLLDEFIFNYEVYAMGEIAEECLCTSCECGEQEKVDTPATFY